MFEIIPNGKGRVRVTEELQWPIWLSCGIDFSVTVPAGYPTDGYSIPQCLWSVVGHPLGQLHLIPAVIHDYLCDQAQTYDDRLLADAVFFHLLTEFGVPRWKRTVFYIGVRIRGFQTMGATR